MATELKNLSDNQQTVNAEGMKIGIVTAEWNNNITAKLYQGAYNTLIDSGVSSDDIVSYKVPGTFELTLGAQSVLEFLDVDAVIVLGCVIQGDTRHFDFICNGVTNGITDLNIKYKKPVIFGVLTTDNEQQAIDRAGGKHGNKGDEAAYTAIKMVDFQRNLAN